MAERAQAEPTTPHSAAGENKPQEVCLVHVSVDRLQLSVAFTANLTSGHPARPERSHAASFLSCIVLTEVKVDHEMNTVV